MSASIATGTTERDGLLYQTGFGNTFESECLPNALPKGRNNPRKVPYNLYAEQLSGTAFTAPRCENRRTWLYRIQPSVANGKEDTTTQQQQQQQQAEYFGGDNPDSLVVNPKPLRWKPRPPPSNNCDFVSGMKLMARGGGSPMNKSGIAIYMYSFNQSMDNGTTNKHLYNADGDFLIVPQQASLLILTELGKLVVHPKDICVIPRGIVFSVHFYNQDDESNNSFARGYVLEIYKGHFQLPELGPIGANGLANARDFLYPTSWCIDNPKDYETQAGTLVRKFASRLFTKTLRHSPYNVVAWHGNYLPFVYNLDRFCAVNSVTYDHLDPSIYTVLTCVGAENGTALADFCIFPPRIMATDSNTLRPPWFHRNTMTEFMGLIQGRYDAKEGFQAGGASLHSCMTPHGPDTLSYSKAVLDECKEPVKFEGGLAFMFETSLMLELSQDALECDHLDRNYEDCWQDLVGNLFTGWDALKKSKE